METVLFFITFLFVIAFIYEKVFDPIVKKYRAQRSISDKNKGYHIGQIWANDSGYYVISAISDTTIEYNYYPVLEKSSVPGFYRGQSFLRKLSKPEFGAKILTEGFYISTDKKIFGWSSDPEKGVEAFLIPNISKPDWVQNYEKIYARKEIPDGLTPERRTELEQQIFRARIDYGGVTKEVMEELIMLLYPECFIEGPYIHRFIWEWSESKINYYNPEPRAKSIISELREVGFVDTWRWEIRTPKENKSGTNMEEVMVSVDIGLIGKDKIGYTCTRWGDTNIYVFSNFHDSIGFASLSRDDLLKTLIEIHSSDGKPNQVLIDSIQLQSGEFSFSPVTKRTHVPSKSLASIGYDRSSHLLEVEFNNEAIYQFPNVPQKIYVEFMKAESFSEYFYDEIWNTYGHRIIVAPKDPILAKLGLDGYDDEDEE